jgi:hypothetical protein
MHVHTRKRDSTQRERMVLWLETCNTKITRLSRSAYDHLKRLFSLCIEHLTFWLFLPTTQNKAPSSWAAGHIGSICDERFTSNIMENLDKRKRVEDFHNDYRPIHGSESFLIDLTGGDNEPQEQITKRTKTSHSFSKFPQLPPTNPLTESRQWSRPRSRVAILDDADPLRYPESIRVPNYLPSSSPMSSSGLAKSKSPPRYKKSEYFPSSSPSMPLQSSQSAPGHIQASKWSTSSRPSAFDSKPSSPLTENPGSSTYNSKLPGKSTSNAKPKKPRTKTPKPPKTEPELCQEQQDLVNLILSGQNVFYTGSAGCGKSTVLKAFVKQLRSQRRKVVIVAPTGRAALEVNGSTYFTFAGWCVCLNLRSLLQVLKFWLSDSERCIHQN